MKINDQLELRLFDLGLSEDFFNSIHSVKNDNDNYRLNLQQNYKTLVDVENRIHDAVENKFKVDGSPDFFIYHQNELIGVFEFHPLSDEDHVEVGYWLYAEFRSKGIMTMVFPFMINYAKEYFSKSKMLATTKIDNIPSQRLLEKNRFTKTGRILDFDGSKEFEYIYSLRVK